MLVACGSTPGADPYANRNITLKLELPSGFIVLNDSELEVVIDEKPDASSLFSTARAETTEKLPGSNVFATSEISATIDSDSNLEWSAHLWPWPFDGGTTWSFRVAGELTKEFQIVARVVADGGERAFGIAMRDTSDAGIIFGPHDRTVELVLACVSGVVCTTDAGSGMDGGADAGTDGGGISGADASAPVWMTPLQFAASPGIGAWAEVFVTPNPTGAGAGVQLIWQSFLSSSSYVYVGTALPWSGVTSIEPLASYDGGGTFLPRITTSDNSSIASWFHADGMMMPTYWTSYWTNWPSDWGSVVSVPTVAPMNYPSTLTVWWQDSYDVVWLDSFDAGAIRYSRSDGGNSFGVSSTYTTAGDAYVLGVRAPTRRSPFYPIVYQGCSLGAEMLCRIRFIWSNQSGSGWLGPYPVDQSDGGNLFEPTVVVGDRAVFSWKKSVGTDGGGAEVWAALCNSAGSCITPMLLGTAQVYARDQYSIWELDSFDMQSNAADDVAVGWVDDDAGIFVSRFDKDAGDVWIPPVRVAPRGARRVRVDVTPSGRVVAAWVENSRVYARWYHKQANVWFDAGEISAGNGDEVSLAVTGESAFAAWSFNGALSGAWCPPP